jgi:hypothetical protein
MDCKNQLMKLFFLLLSSIILITACSDKKQGANVNNTFYVNISSDDDSLTKQLVKYIDGKVSFRINGKLEIVPETYLADELKPDMHYFKVISNMDKDIKKGTKKIELDVKGKLLVDSTFYSMPRYVYDGKNWKKISDIGSIQATLDPSLTKRPKFKPMEIVTQVRENLVNSTYE